MFQHNGTITFTASCGTTVLLVFQILQGQFYPQSEFILFLE